MQQEAGLARASRYMAVGCMYVYYNSLCPIATLALLKLYMYV